MTEYHLKSGGSYRLIAFGEGAILRFANSSKTAFGGAVLNKTETLQLIKALQMLTKRNLGSGTHETH